MDDRRRNELMNQYDELTMQLLMDEAAENDGNLLWEDFTAHGTQTMPKELDDTCQKLIRTAFKKEERKRRWRKTTRRNLRAAVVVLFLLIPMFSVIMKVDAVRIPMMNYCIVTYEKFSTIVFGEKEPEPAPKDLKEVMESVLPVGYTLFSEEAYSPDSICIAYVSGEDTLCLDTFTADNVTNYDTENTLVYESVICEVPVLVRERYDPDVGFVSIIWLNEDETLVYDLVATALSLNELQHIAAPLIEFTAK